MEDDVEAVAAEARRRDPSLAVDAAEVLARAALALPPSADAPEIARSLLDGDGGLDASWAAAVAASVVELRSS